MSARPYWLLSLLCSIPPALSAQRATSGRPPEVTDSAVARGQALYEGAGNCAACHGTAGVGTGSGPPLAQGVWLHGEDSFAGIVQRVVHGIPREVSTRDIAMPMRGWTTLTDGEVRDVAAYVWVISHPWIGR